MYYLQKICILIENEEERQAMDASAEHWKKAGIEVEHEEDFDAALRSPGDEGEPRGLGEKVLYVTDSGEMARKLLIGGSAVLVWLHERNRAQSFVGVKYAFEDPEALDTEYMERVYRRYVGIPWDILETERCLLRETVEEDVPAFYKIYSEPVITAYMEDLFENPEDELAYTRDYREKVYEFYGFGIWTVIKKDTGEIIGRAGCTYREGFDDPELGFVIGVPWQRSGYAEEVCRAILKYAKEYLGFERMQAFVKEGNEASVRLCEKLGMRETERISLTDNYMEKAKGCAFDSAIHICFVKEISP